MRAQSYSGIHYCGTWLLNYRYSMWCEVNFMVHAYGMEEMPAWCGIVKGRTMVIESITHSLLPIQAPLKNTTIFAHPYLSCYCACETWCADHFSHTHNSCIFLLSQLGMCESEFVGYFGEAISLERSFLLQWDSQLSLLIPDFQFFFAHTLYKNIS